MREVVLALPPLGRAGWQNGSHEFPLYGLPMPAYSSSNAAVKRLTQLSRLMIRLTALYVKGRHEMRL